MTKHHGFTLIELMIVVAIIGILASIAIPTYSQYTARAQATEATTLLGSLKITITQQYSESSVFTIPTGSTVDGKYVSAITKSSPNSIEASFKGVGSVASKLIGKTIRYTYTTSDGKWVCTSDLDSTVKPKGCD